MRRLSDQVNTPIEWKDSIPAPVPDNRSSSQKRLANFFILISTLFERLAFYALMSALFNTLRMPELFNWSNKLSKAALYTFSGTTYLSTVIFAIITDAKFGRAVTIIFGFIFYAIGFMLITITTAGNTLLCTSHNNSDHNDTTSSTENCIAPIFTTIILTSLGAGAVKGNLAVFGAEQLQNSKAATKYFNSYAIALNIGIMSANIIIPIIQHIVHDHYYVPYTVAGASLLLALAAFLLGWKYYIHVKANETVVAKICPVLSNAIRSWCKHRKHTHKRHRTGSGTQIRLLNSASGSIEIEESITVQRMPTFLDYAIAANQGKFQDRVVKDVKSLVGGVCVFTLLVPFWLVYNQSTTTFPLQGEQMSGSDPSYVVSFMSIADPIVVIVGVIIIKVYTHKKNLDIQHTSSSITKRFVLGMIFAILSMLTAGLVEHFRQSQCDGNSGKSRLSIFAQIPQNMLIGFSQLTGMIACYTYAFLAAPLSAQSLFMSLYFCSIGAASFLDIGLMYIFPTTSVDIDFQCQSDHQWYWSFYSYFYILGGIQLFFMIIFILCQRYYNIVKLNPQHMESSSSTRTFSFSYEDI